jgi:hypothetical protein
VLRGNKKKRTFYERFGGDWMAVIFSQSSREPKVLFALLEICWKKCWRRKNGTNNWGEGELDENTQLKI